MPVNEEPRMKILVPTDGSVAARKAEGYALRLARMIGGRVIALHVVEHREDPLHRLWLRARNELLGHAQSDGVDIVEELKGLGRREGVEVEGVIRRGRPSEEILRHISENRDLDLIIIAPRRMGLLSRLLLGSTTERLVREIGKLVSCPVLITPP